MPVNISHKKHSGKNGCLGIPAALSPGSAAHGPAVFRADRWAHDKGASLIAAPDGRIPKAAPIGHIETHAPADPCRHRKTKSNR
jgi:hypothetical protein